MRVRGLHLRKDPHGHRCSFVQVNAASDPPSKRTMDMRRMVPSTGSCEATTFKSRRTGSFRRV